MGLHLTDMHAHYLMLITVEGVPAGSPSRGGDVAVYVFDVNQPCLPIPFYSVRVSTSVFMAMSTVFHSMNSPENSLLSHSVLPVLFMPYSSHWSFQLYTSLWNWKSHFSPDKILCGWLGLKHQLSICGKSPVWGCWDCCHQLSDVHRKFPVGTRGRSWFKSNCRIVRITVNMCSIMFGGGFSSCVRILGECSTVHSPPALLKWKLACAHLFHSLGQDQSTVAQQAETTDRLCPDKLHVSSFPNKFPHYA